MYNCAIALLLLLACHARAEFLTFDSRATWEANWSLKPQLNIFTPAGAFGADQVPQGHQRRARRPSVRPPD